MPLADVIRAAYLLARYKLGQQSQEEAYAEQQRKILAEMQERERQQKALDLEEAAQRLREQAFAQSQLEAAQQREDRLKAASQQQRNWEYERFLETQRPYVGLDVAARQRELESEDLRKQLAGQVLGQLQTLGLRAQAGEQVPFGPRQLEALGLSAEGPDLETQLSAMSIPKLIAAQAALAQYSPPGTVTTVGGPSARTVLRTPTQLEQTRTQLDELTARLKAATLPAEIARADAELQRVLVQVKNGLEDLRLKPLEYQVRRDLADSLIQYRPALLALQEYDAQTRRLSEETRALLGQARLELDRQVAEWRREGGMYERPEPAPKQSPVEQALAGIIRQRAAQGYPVTAEQIAQWRRLLEMAFGGEGDFFVPPAAPPPPPAPEGRPRRF